MLAKVPAKTSAASPTVGQSKGLRPLNGTPAAARDAAAKVAIRNVGNGKSKATAPAKSASKTPRIKVEKYSYKMPKSEHDAIIALKEKLNEQGIKVKKSELIRAAVRVFVGFSDARIKASLKAI